NFIQIIVDTLFFSHVSFCFFFYIDCAYLDIHSFPTRRSSDLSRSCRSRTTRRWLMLAVARSSRSPCFRRRSSATASFSSTPKRRSEEHTSELQSRFDLVCRLLLEKKKKQDDNYKHQLLI